MEKYNPYDPYTSSYQYYSSQYQQPENTYQFTQPYAYNRFWMHAGERPSHYYLGMGDFVVSDEDEYNAKHDGRKPDDFIISDDVQSSEPPAQSYSTDEDSYEYKYETTLKEPEIMRVVKRVRLGEGVKYFEIAISRDTYLYWAYKYNDKYGLGEASLNRKRGKAKKDNVNSLLNACKHSK